MHQDECVNYHTQRNEYGSILSGDEGGNSRRGGGGGRNLHFSGKSKLLGLGDQKQSVRHRHLLADLENNQN